MAQEAEVADIECAGRILSGPAKAAYHAYCADRTPLHGSCSFSMLLLGGDTRVNLSRRTLADEQPVRPEDYGPPIAEGRIVLRCGSSSTRKEGPHLMRDVGVEFAAQQSVLRRWTGLL